MKKVKSLKDLQRLMESLGATKDEDPGFTSWTLDCGPGRKPSSAKLQEGIDYEVDNIDDYIKRVKS
jgi:hypothetical protein